MSLYKRILQDLDLIEADVQRFCGSSTYNLENNIEALRYVFMFVAPYLDSHLGKTYSLRQLEDFKDGNEFIDFWLQKVECSTGPSCDGDECLWHTANYFYKSSHLLEWENDWVKCVEGVVATLDSVHHIEEATFLNEFRTIKQGLGLLLCFHKSVANWNLKKWEEIMLTDEMSRHMKDYVQRVMLIFKLLPLTNVDRKNDISTLVEEILNYASYWRKIRKSRPLNQTLEDPCGPDYETLVCVTDDLGYLLSTLLDDLPSQMVPDINDIAAQMDGFQCALSPTWTKIFVESGISYAIARDIYTSADKASHIISDLNTHDTQKRIGHIRDVAWRIYMKYNLTPSCIDDFFTCARLILEEVVLTNTPAARYVRELSLLHTFIKDTENMLPVSIKLQEKYHQIQIIFCDAWMQIWSLCLREPKCRKEFLTLSLDIFKDIAANILKPGDLLVDLIEDLVQMPKANELLHELHRSLVKAEDDNLFVKLVYSLEKNLVRTLTIEGVGDVVEDVEVEVIEAAHNYILFFREFKNDAPSGLKEGVEGFKASLRHAYDEYIKLPSMELSMSELEFFDMLVNLTEFKKNDTYNAELIGVLSDDLSNCFSFLQPYTMRRDKPEEVKQLWTQIMKLGRKVDNMIDTFEELPTWYSELRVFYVSEEVNLIKEHLSNISGRDISTTEVEGSDIHAENQIEKSHATDHSKDEVSFEEEDRLRVQLTTGSRSLEKISIVGMPGLGKTTLAMRLYKDCAKSFNAHAWCYVGQEFQRKELLQHIIGQISERPRSEISVMGNEDLAKLLKQCLLQKKNYLIVLDDVWDVDAWDALRICFPPSHDGSRILITSRYSIVGEKICDKNVVKLKLLTADKSWHLLQKKVFGMRSCPKRLCEVGKGIAEKCGGLPLSIVMIAGVLKNKSETEDGWKEIEWSLDDHLLNAGSSTVELSYRHLSFRVKQCFLYCGAFSKGTEIPRSKLIRLWLAERFVEILYEQESLESVAEKYLRDLVDRNLLMVAKRGCDHRIQACRIHDLLLDFCIQKAKAEKFLIPMDRWYNHASPQKHGRLCATSDQLMKFNLEGSTHLKPRSLICSRSLFELWKPSLFVFENFKSLALLDLERLSMDDYSSSFYASVGELTMLRYLSIRGWMKSIPSSISHLLNLETLIVRGTRGEVEVPHTIFSLSKLRDLLVDKRARICVHPSNDNADNSLSCLQNFSTPVLSRSIADQIIVRLPNLRKLRCIVLGETFDWSILDRLCHLESLRVFYQSWSPFCGNLIFPTNLYKLTLSGFRLPWLDIEKIADMLPRLEILKLLLRACEGEQWRTTATFKNLKYLRMEGLNIKSWEASDDNFPTLERLVVRRCKSLNKIPEDFGKMGELMGIEAHWCDTSLVKSVVKIKRKQIDEGNMKFEAIIYPPVLDISDDEELSE